MPILCQRYVREREFCEFCEFCELFSVGQGRDQSTSHQGLRTFPSGKFTASVIEHLLFLVSVDQRGI